jgi:nitrogen-specific signal transduction histidine kinase/CheY-like chemotaxis protein
MVRVESGRTVCLSVIEDISERKRREAHARNTLKMEALTRLAGEMVYRLNHLMLSTLGSSRLLLENMQADDRSRPLVESIRDTVDSAADLTRQLVAFCSREVVELTNMDLNALLQRLEPRLRELLGREIELRLKLAPGLAMVQADHEQLERVLLVLAANARDAMPQGGRLQIQTGVVEFPRDPAQAEPGWPQGTHVAITVSDTGCGMEPKTIDRLYEPFFSTKERGQTSGLGLAAAYGIIKQFGGHIEASSEIGRGSSFRIYLPVGPDTVFDLELPAELVDTAPHGLTVLLVSDDEPQRSRTRQILRSVGYEVIEARYGGEALLQCLRHEGPIHLLLADAYMAHVTGRQLADQALPLRPDLKVLLLGGPPVVPHAGVPPTSTLSPLTDAISYLTSPWSVEDLVSGIRQVLNGAAAPAPT